MLENELAGYGVKLQGNVLKKLLREYSVNTKEELFVNIRAYAKETLTEEAYKIFNEMFKSVLQTVVE